MDPILFGTIPGGGEVQPQESKQPRTTNIGFDEPKVLDY